MLSCIYNYVPIVPLFRMLATMSPYDPGKAWDQYLFNRRVLNYKLLK